MSEDSVENMVSSEGHISDDMEDDDTPLFHRTLKRAASSSPQQNRRSPNMTGSGPSPKMEAPFPIAPFRYTNMPTNPLSTQNRFALLPEVDSTKTNTVPTSPTKSMRIEPNSNADKQSPKVNGGSEPNSQQKKEHLPPITITQAFGTADANKMRDHGAFEIRRAGNSTKIYTSTTKDFGALTEYCKEAQIPFFTHQLRTTGKLSVVLKGIEGYTPKEILDELKLKGVPPIEVRAIPTKSANSLFGVDFNKAETSLAKLNANLSRLLYHRVVWETSRKRNSGPTICRNCAMFGHGMQSCHRPSVCIYCAQNHSISDCPNVIADTEERQKSMCCINCQSRGLKFDDHAANHAQCPVRTLFIQSKDSKSKPTPSKRPPANVFRSSVRNNTVSWPKLPTPKTNRLTSNSPSASSSSKKPSLGTSFDSAAYANATRRPHESVTNANDLFSIDQVVEITFEAINALQKCNNRYDQLRVIAQLLQKCLSD